MTAFHFWTEQDHAFSGKNRRVMNTAPQRDAVTCDERHLFGGRVGRKRLHRKGRLGFKDPQHQPNIDTLNNQIHRDE